VITQPPPPTSAKEREIDNGFSTNTGRVPRLPDCHIDNEGIPGQLRVTLIAAGTSAMLCTFPYCCPTTLPVRTAIWHIYRDKSLFLFLFFNFQQPKQMFSSRKISYIGLVPRYLVYLKCGDKSSVTHRYIVGGPGPNGQAMPSATRIFWQWADLGRLEQVGRLDTLDHIWQSHVKGF
jgi:hypothetical protein